ncbi:MAG: AMP-binding protein, partial [Caulobacter sp.]
MHPYLHAQSQGDKAAYVMSGSGEVVTYAQLDARSNQGAHLFRSLGLVPGDVIAILMENNARFFEVAWAAQRSGLYFVCISTKLTAAEAEYILQDCGAKVFITSTAMGPVIDEIAALVPGLSLFTVGGAHGPYADLVAARDSQPTTPIADESAGADMLYSSGTTGRPKGVKPALSDGPIDAPNALQMMAQGLFGFSGD